MLIVELHGPSIPVRPLEPVETVLFEGRPNRLSRGASWSSNWSSHLLDELTHTTIPSIAQAKPSGCGEISSTA